MKQGCFALLLMFFCGVALADGSGFGGTYTCQGYDPYLNRSYTGSIVIYPDETVYKLDMVYDTGDKDIGTGGMYDKDLLSVVFQSRKDLKHVGLEQYHFTDNNTKISGFWVYLGKNKLGREVCERDKKS
jgi:hypothetical protein